MTNNFINPVNEDAYENSVILAQLHLRFIVRY